MLRVGTGGGHLSVLEGSPYLTGHLGGSSLTFAIPYGLPRPVCGTVTLIYANRTPVVCQGPPSSFHMPRGQQQHDFTFQAILPAAPQPLQTLALCPSPRLAQHPISPALGRACLWPGLGVLGKSGGPGWGQRLGTAGLCPRTGPRAQPKGRGPGHSGLGWGRIFGWAAGPSLPLPLLRAVLAEAPLALSGGNRASSKRTATEGKRERDGEKFVCVCA